jgi:hypothetical protein
VSTYGATIDSPTFDQDSDFRLCLQGNYCDAANDENVGGTGREVQCPIGTYMPYYGATELADCVECQAGYYCPDEGTITPTACENTWGYYCPESTGAEADRESCNHGFFCPAKAHMEYRCALGYYTDSTWTATSSNWASCDTCPGGSYCIATTTDAVDYDNNPFSGTASPTQCTDEYFC